MRHQKQKPLIPANQPPTPAKQVHDSGTVTREARRELLEDMQAHPESYAVQTCVLCRGKATTALIYNPKDGYTDADPVVIVGICAACQKLPDANE
jgi:hypothetical protein